jgi:hypothetical protein
MVGGLVFFGRMLDKIRLSAQGKLPGGLRIFARFPVPSSLLVGMHLLLVAWLMLVNGKVGK